MQTAARCLAKHKRAVYPALFLGSCLLLILSGCASLPNIKSTLHYYYASHTHGPPSIIGPDGELSKAERKAIFNRLQKQAGPHDILAKQTALMQSLTGRPLVAGNRVTLLQDGKTTFAAMFRALANAHHNINVETFIFDDDRIGRIFAALLLQKHAQGVAVNLIYDSYGCYKTPTAFFATLKKAGIRVLEFNPINPLKIPSIGSIDHRDHRKMLIVDGKLVVTGGVNINSTEAGTPSGSFVPGESSAPWYDTDIEITGPAVAEYQKLFMNQWHSQKGPSLAPGNYFPHLQAKGNHLVRVIADSPGQWSRQTYLAYVSAMAFSQKSIHLATPYFVPDEQTLQALLGAARRGVDVKIILPGKSDSKLAYYGGRSYYAQLLRAGVKVYEFRNAMVHSKIAVIDKAWSTVGSTNLDPWSLMRNYEVNAVILGRGFGNNLEGLFASYLSRSREILLADWQRRPAGEHLKEWFSRLIWYWL